MHGPHQRLANALPAEGVGFFRRASTSLRHDIGIIGAISHAMIFCGKTLALGYGLFYCWPYA